MKQFAPGDTVRFTDAVCQRVGLDYHTSYARGTVKVVPNRSWVRVDFHGTFDSEDGRRIRCIPVANLTKFQP